MMELIREAIYFDTVKLVTVRNIKLGLFHRALQIAVLVYIAVFAIWYKQGYQATSEVSGVIYTKLKGVAHTKGNPLDTYDAGDLVVPGTEKGAVFITTRSLQTIQTKNHQCPDDSDLLKNNCSKPTDCVAGKETSFGYVIGDQCNNETKKCNVSAWCPVETEWKSPFAEYQGLEDWTIFIRSEVRYDQFNISAHNAVSIQENVNLFHIRDLLKGQNLTDVMTYGVIVNIQLDWSCNLDKGICDPNITWHCLQEPPGSASHGFNFRTVEYFNNNLSVDSKEVFQTRVLTKLYGIRLVLEIKGQGRKFDVFVLAITLGAGIAFLAGATLITDIILQHFHPAKEKFVKAKHNNFEFDAPLEESQQILINQ